MEMDALVVIDVHLVQVDADTIITDRYPQIAKYISTELPETTLLFYIWCVAKG